MRTILRILTVCLSAWAVNAQADAVFNLRAALESGYYVSGTVAVDTANGLVTGESSTLYRNGVALSTFGAPSSQGVFAPGGGIAPSYLFSSAGPGGYLFVGAVPQPSLVGYGGGGLCAITSSVNCAYSDLFRNGSQIANVVQGVLAPAGDTIRVFDLSATFENGDRLSGTVTIDTTIGFVLDSVATLFSGTTVVDTFFNPLVQSPFAPAMLTPSFIETSIGANGVLLNVATPGDSLVNYLGGDLCAVSSPSCALSDIFLTSTLSSNAINGRLSLRGANAVPEPASWAMLLIGIAAAFGARRRRAG